MKKLFAISLLISALAMAQVSVTPTAPNITYTPSSLAFLYSSPIYTIGIGSGGTGPAGAFPINLTGIKGSPSLSASGLQVTFTYTTSDVISITASAGAAATGGGKTVQVGTPVVSGGNTSVTIAMVPNNKTTIGDGVWAIVTPVVNKTTTFTISNAVATSKFGTPIATALSSSTSTVTVPVNIAGAFTCDPTENAGMLMKGEQTTCHASAQNNTATAITVMLNVSDPTKFVIKNLALMVVNSCSIAAGTSVCDFIVEGI